jgi:hypothetical protein
LKIDRVLVIALYLEPALVQQRVMKRAEQREVLKARRSALRPMLDVVRVDVAAVVASGERAVPVARPERALERSRDGPALAANVERRAVLVLDDRDEAPVAGEAPDSLDRQVGPPEPSREG